MKNITIEIKKSPAKVNLWHVLVNGLRIETFETRKGARFYAESLSNKYGYEVVMA